MIKKVVQLLRDIRTQFLIFNNKQKTDYMHNPLPFYWLYIPFQPISYGFPQPEEQTYMIKDINCTEYSKSKFSEIENQKIYHDMLVKQLQINNNKFQKKVWTSHEINTLIELKKRGLVWQQISDQIPGTNAQICKRKHQRVINEEKRWPKELDDRVKTLFQIENRSWKQIYCILKVEFHISQRKRLRLIKQRYMLHLRPQISKQCWSVDEDLKLLKLVKQQGRRWKQISKNLNGRTELQVKNRYYGTLLPIQNRTIKRLEEQINR